jgi:hypothetical protein
LTVCRRDSLRRLSNGRKLIVNRTIDFGAKGAAQQTNLSTPTGAWQCFIKLGIEPRKPPDRVLSIEPPVRVKLTGQLPE